MSLRLEDIQAFLNVVELGSISAAAERMSLSKSVISKRVSDLERHLGVRLLYRSTRNVEPTEAGGFFYKSAKASLQDLNNAAESVALRENDLCGELRVMAPMSFGTLWLGPLVMEFMARNPRLEVVLQLDDRIVDFEKEGYDLAIRITRLQDSSLIARQLGTSRRVVCCSPELPGTARPAATHRRHPLPSLHRLQPQHPVAAMELRAAGGRRAGADDHPARTLQHQQRPDHARRRGAWPGPGDAAAVHRRRGPGRRPAGRGPAAGAAAGRPDLRHVFASGNPLAEGEAVRPVSPAGPGRPAVGRALSLAQRLRQTLSPSPIGSSE
ncbi:LysR family transcriptional regulator [Pseudomonas aeruginosa]